MNRFFSGLEEGATRLPGFSRAFIQGSAGDTPFLAAGAVCGAFLISGEVTGNEKTCRKLLRDLGNETAFFVPLGFLYGRAGIRLDFLALAPRCLRYRGSLFLKALPERQRPVFKVQAPNLGFIPV